MKYTVDALIDKLKNNNHVVFTNDVKEFNLNLVAVRSANRVPNTFDDLFYVFYKYNGAWTIKEYNVTVDPGAVYLQNPINDSGTAIIMPNQYRSLWKLGYHKGKYRALVQNRPCTVARDNNRDLILNSDIPPYANSYRISKGGIIYELYLDNDEQEVFKTETGMFGINCHKSGKGTTEFVNYYGAGCVVFANNDLFDNDFIPVCEAAANNFGNSFTFALLNE